ncbi:TPM domain-containing protein [Albibacterium sp.]|uniref:TPM domain-containing protein n=1 Tax=Albibacterium sp. TaxID=2952885 RepID=UPI002CFA3B7D|nr:TPM domain-containing protein [Albibacterium sp.]HUH20116.1 TPM domain-containing protein [Albibacterium sp.]
MKLFNNQQEEKIMHAINMAENRTSGEIRVCIEKKCPHEAIAQAVRRFSELDMHKTALKNGVLIYLAIEDHKFAIIGDEGINKKVPENFWEETKNIMADLFKKEQFAEGLIAGIHRAGKQLKTFFPRSDDDINELPNEVVYF